MGQYTSVQLAAQKKYLQKLTFFELLRQLPPKWRLILKSFYKHVDLKEMSFHIERKVIHQVEQ